MSFESQMLFFFSALGAFNGIFLSFYFAFFNKQRKRASYFLSALLLVISVRVAKSTFLIFYPGISSTFVEIGLMACFLIGPFLFLYTKETLHPSKASRWNWLLHIMPVVILMLIVHLKYPYLENRHMWHRSRGGPFGWLLFSQWLVYVIISLYMCRKVFAQAFKRSEKMDAREFWLINVVVGVALIWIAYNNGYTSYILGAVSFSFVLYLSVLFWIFKKRKKLASFFEERPKYANKKISSSEAAQMLDKLGNYFSEGAPYRNPNLKMRDVANALNIPPHQLSQLLNDNLGKSFTHYINEYRIKDATASMQQDHSLTLEAIGINCGFRSNSTFYAAFKKVHGVTPAQFKKRTT